MIDLARGHVVWVELDPTLGREQGGRRPALVVASDAFLARANRLVIVVPGTTTDRGWPNHVPLVGPRLSLPRPTWAMVEQPRTLSRERIVGDAGRANPATMAAVDQWLRDFLAL